MEKENVLEIEFMPVWDKWAWRIVKQNEEVLKRGIFDDIYIGVYSTNIPNYNCMLGIRGDNKDKDDLINLCTEDEKKEIEEKVKAINEKYGLKKRWRAEYSKNYFYINEMFKIKFDTESYWDIDNKRYENGNYFRTEQDAKEYMEYIKHKSLEWHERKEE